MKQPHRSGQRQASVSRPPASPPGSPVADDVLVTDLLPRMAAGIAVLAANLTLSSWNPYAEQLTGYALRNIHKVGLAQIFEPVEVMQHILRKAQEGIPTLSEYLRLRRADGQLTPVTVQCSPQRHLRESDCHIVVTFRPIEPMQEHLRHDEHLAMLGRLASALSHEIRNPLNAVFLHADVLEDEWRQPSPDSATAVAASLADIKTELNRLSDLVQDYLSLARLTTLHREPMALGAIVERFAAEMQQDIADNDLTLHLEGLETLGEVQLHQNTFRRVLLNLVHNALEATPPGGTITLRGVQKDDRAQLVIQDTGQGISPEELPLLFTPFHSTKPDGTGLGLYVVHQIVTAHGGEMSVASTPGAGTTFTITFPLASASDVDPM